MESLLKEYRKQLLKTDIFFPYKRECFSFLKEALLQTNLCLIGLRQVGKTTLMLQLASWFFQNKIKNKKNEGEISNVLYDEDQIFYINLKAIQNINNEINLSKLREVILDLKYKLIVLDEIQEIENWTNFMQTIIDLKPNAKFIVSGSSASSLKKEYMVGRMSVYFITPLLFNEYKKIWKDNNIDSYLKYGSYPKSKDYESVNLQYRALVKDSIINKIIINDYKNNIDGKKFSALLADINNYIGNELKSSKLEKSNIARQTVSLYLKLMSNSHLIHSIPKFNDKNSSRKYKVYYEDKSMIYYFNEFHELNNNLRGSLIENIVFNYLFYKYMNNTMLDKIFYYRNNKEQELDFIIPKEKLIIECKYIDNMNVENIIKNIKNIVEQDKKINDYKVIVINKTLNQKKENIEFISLKKFLELEYGI